MRSQFLDAYMWMSHVGKGRNERLIDVLEVVFSQVDRDATRRIANTLRVNLLRVGHIYNIGNKIRTWAVHAPSLIMQSGNNEAYWLGGIDTEFQTNLFRIAGNQLVYIDRSDSFLPPYFGIRGDESIISDMAAQLGVPFFVETYLHKSANLVPISQGIDYVASLPKTHIDCLTKFVSNAPVEVLKYAPPGCAIRFFGTRHGRVFSVEKSNDAIFFAAMNEHRICYYKGDTRELISLVKLPLAYEFPLCLCTGHLPKTKGSKLIYSAVPPELGNQILGLLGQDVIRPQVHWL